MSTFAFEVMSQGQASGFAAADSLVIANPSSSTPANTSVTFSGENVTIGLAGRSLTFGAAFTDQVRSIRPGGQSGVIIGTPRNDAITGYGLATDPFTAPGDALFGGAGDDTINGGYGSDTLSGGEGNDVFVFFVGQGTDVVTDFRPNDRLAFAGISASGADYAEGVFATEAAAAIYAQTEIGAGRINIVVAQVGANLIITVDGRDANAVSSRIILLNAGLDDVDRATFLPASTLGPVASPPSSPPPVDAPPPRLPPAVPTPQPTAPAAPAVSGNIGAHGDVRGDMDLIHFGDLRGAQVVEATVGVHTLTQPGISLRMGGSLNYYNQTQLVGGQVGFVDMSVTRGGAFSALIGVNGNGFNVTAFSYWVDRDANTEALTTIFAGNDSLSGGAGADRIRTFAGDDTILCNGGADTVFAGLGNDVIRAGDAPGATSGGTYLRGEEGDDWIGGGSGFDDANGNQGADTITTGAGDDYCVGGRDNDLLFGDAGQDFVYGNLGDDTCEGGDGNDILRGGQDNDIVRGGAGDDFVSGDKGADTMTGGTGADIFHTFGDAGVDLVTDFNFADGDRVQLDPGTRYTVAQVGNDTEISMTGGAKMILVGVALLSLSPGWIFGA